MRIRDVQLRDIIKMLLRQIVVILCFRQVYFNSAVNKQQRK